MATSLIGTADSPKDYTDYTIWTFPDWRAMDAYAKNITAKKPNPMVDRGNAAFKEYVNEILADPNHPKMSSFGLFGKQPKDYDEAIARKKFLYYDEYKAIKKKVEKKIMEELKKSSEAQAMQPKLVYNDRELGEFVFDRAAMSLVPEIFFYAPKLKREVDTINEKVIQDGNLMVLEKDRSIQVIYAFKVDVEGKDEPEYVEVNGEASLQEAVSKGIVDCTSNNKKVYLYKEKKPRMKNAVKIIIAMTAGGWTNWENDFYSGVAAGVVTEVLESLGYAVDVEVVMGGGRCTSCGYSLNFKNRLTIGRRFFSFTAKKFDEPLDLDGLLYTLCDPSFHNVKFVSLLNHFFNFFGDEIQDPNSNRGNAGNFQKGAPNATWHGIELEDMTNPLGMYHKKMDWKKGNENLIHFYIHRVASEADVIQEMTNLVLTCENMNLESLKLSKSNDFKFD